MKKNLAALIIILCCLFSTPGKAQQAEYYKQAISTLQEQLTNPDLSQEDKDAIREAIKETKEILNELQSDTPVYGESDDSNTNSNSNNYNPPAAEQPKPTKEYPNRQSSGGAMTSGNAN